MKSNYLLLLITTVVLLNSCKKDVDPPIVVSPTELVNLAIIPNFGGEEFEAGQVYINATDYRVSFEALKFYLGDINLIKSDGSKVLLSEIEFYSETSDEMNKSFIVPNGTYTGIEYSFGVPENLGGTNNPDFDPVVYPAGHPLNLDNGMYWSWNAGYRFSVIEGRYNTNATGTDPLISTFSYHPGTQTLYRTFEVGLPFTLDGDESTQINIDLDLSKLFFNDTETLDCADPMENNLAGMNTNTLGIKYIGLFVGAVDHSLN